MEKEKMEIEILEDGRVYTLRRIADWNGHPAVLLRNPSGKVTAGWQLRGLFDTDLDAPVSRGIVPIVVAGRSIYDPDRVSRADIRRVYEAPDSA